MPPSSLDEEEIVELPVDMANADRLRTEFYTAFVNNLVLAKRLRHTNEELIKEQKQLKERISRLEEELKNRENNCEAVLQIVNQNETEEPNKDEGNAAGISVSSTSSPLDAILGTSGALQGSPSPRRSMRKRAAEADAGNTVSKKQKPDDPNEEHPTMLFERKENGISYTFNVPFNQNVKSLHVTYGDNGVVFKCVKELAGTSEDPAQL